MRETMKEFTRKDLEASLLRNPKFEKMLTDALKEDREMHKQVDEARKRGTKLPAWAYPPYIVKAYPDIFLKQKKKRLAATPRKMR